MRRAPCCGMLLLLVASQCLAGPAAALLVSKVQPVTVLLEYDKPESPLASRALKSELSKIFSGSKIQLSLRLRKQLPDYAQFDDPIVLFRMRGACTMMALPVAALSDERGPLAMTHMVNGEMLPFGEVECDRVRTSLQRKLGRTSAANHETQMGIALARVIAHEVYHMMARSTTHTKDGLTKAALSSEELYQGELPLPKRASSKLDRP